MIEKTDRNKRIYDIFKEQSIKNQRAIARRYHLNAATICRIIKREQQKEQELNNGDTSNL